MKSLTNSEWASGYVTDIGYSFGYYSELNPNSATLAILYAGYEPPSSGVHCELGCGQGLSVNVHAAATGATWYATDFNPTQAAFAQSLASASGAKAYLYDEAFADFCNRTDLPEFDSIGLHGIWSWISDENRAVIVDFIRRKLKVGGALYISYNTLPGWATFAPMRHLMTEHASVMGSPGKGVVNRIDGALDFAQKLIDTNPMFAITNPGVVDRLKKLAVQARHYLAHEYFNKDWHPMHFATVNQWLSPAKIKFACSAHYLDHIDSINLSSTQQAMLKEIADPSFKESVRDFMVNQQFRKDYWIKGARQLSAFEQAELIKQHRLVLITAREEVSLNITCHLGVANMSEAIYTPILDYLAGHKSRSVGEIAEHVKTKGILLPQVIQAVMVLTGVGHLASVQTNEKIAKAKESARKLNLSILDKARYGNNISFLASPVIGGGVGVNRYQQLFLLALSQGKKQPKEWAQAACDVLASQNQRVVTEGKVIDSSEGNLKQMIKLAETFNATRLAVLRELEAV
jgi:SAM-dependent methyltransferase